MTDKSSFVEKVCNISFLLDPATRVNGAAAEHPWFNAEQDVRRGSEYSLLLIRQGRMNPVERRSLLLNKRATFGIIVSRCSHFVRIVFVCVPFLLQLIETPRHIQIYGLRSLSEAVISYFFKAFFSRSQTCVIRRSM